jgi:hypothetical protein
LKKSRQQHGENLTYELELPLSAKLIVPIPDTNGNNMVTVRHSGAGKVTFSLTIFDPNYTMAGPLYKVSESLLSNAWKKRWFVLTTAELLYYNSEFALEASKNAVITGTVTALKDETYKNRNGFKLSFTVDGKEDYWLLDFDEKQLRRTPKIKDAWLRRFHRCCPALADSTTTGSHDKAGTLPPGPIHKTKTPMSKRMSVFK